MKYILFFTLYISTLIISFLIIFLERKRPEKTIAWLMLCIVFPPLGLLLYIFVGREWKRHRLEDYENTRELHRLIGPILKDEKYKKYSNLIELMVKNSESPIFYNNVIKIYKDGEEKFKDFKEELLKAKHHIHLEYYIVNSDKIGNEIKDILIKKANEGVEVRFIIDRMGSVKTKKSFLNEMRKSGIDIVVYSYFLAPIFRVINTQINYRNHKKIAVIDGKIGFIGGMNIGDEYLGKGKFGYWRDTTIMVKGDFVLGLQSFFLDDYISIKKVNQSKDIFPTKINEYFPLIEEEYGQELMQLVKSGPNSEYPAIMHTILKMIYMATKKINISTPYFVPSESIMEGLKIALLSGVEVNILFPDLSDHKIVHYASRTYLYELMKCGAKVYFYKKEAFMHAKVITVDDEIVTVGSANMDIRSFELNYEANAVIYDIAVVKKFNNQFCNDMKQSKIATLEEFEKCKRCDKFLEGLCRILSALL